MNDRPALAIAGPWRAWEAPSGVSLSFTMLTVNADEHTLMKRFHRPGAEKRPVVIVRPEEYDDWLPARATDEAWSFMNLFAAEEMVAEPRSSPPRKSRTNDAGDATPLF
ncbi:SOS response-associated peptidase family protein [Paraburkholderia ginsengiterrae]|uniref:SOS response-associated peptidase family protein n=1 Tax=Paraburkholderia ginsengiterrae TaxID=1462993 RepID=UPI00094FC853|nr:SOS response-associated peptidase family protein [Paraburkholderia ginsengiterrae]